MSADSFSGPAGFPGNIRFLLIIALAVVAFAVRLYLFAPERNFSPDSVDYINIARNMAEGRGFLHSIKWHFFTDHPAAHSAVAERPPLYPILLSVVWRMGGRLFAINFLNVLLGVGVIVLLFFLYEKVLGSAAQAALAAVLVAVNPSVAKACVFPWTEPLFLLLHTLALLLILGGLKRMEDVDPDAGAPGAEPSEGAPPSTAPRRTGQPRLAEYAFLGAGFAAAFAYLTRPSALALIAAIVVLLAWRRRWRPLGLFLFPCAGLLAVWFAVVWIAKGSPFYSVQGHHFRVIDITDGMAAGWGREIPTAAEFARMYSIPLLVAHSVLNYLLEFFSRWFLALTAFGFLGLRAVLRRPGAGLLFACGLFHFLLAGAVWATHEGDRLLQPTFVCLVPLCVGGLFGAVRWALPKDRDPRLGVVPWAVALGACLVTLVLYGIDLAQAREVLLRRPPLSPLSAEGRAWIDERLRLPQDLVVASDDPFLCNWWLDRPTVQLPSRLVAENASRFFQEFGVSLVAVLNPDAPHWREIQAPLIHGGHLVPLQVPVIEGFRWFRVGARKAPLPAGSDNP